MSPHHYSLTREANTDTRCSKLDARRLFTTNETKVEFLSISMMSNDVLRASRLLIDKKALEECLDNVKNEPSMSFFLLQQQDSWDRIEISLCEFLLLLSHFGVFSAFDDLVQGFGLKFEPKDENYTGLHSRLLHETRGIPSVFEICFNVRYIAENNHGDPKAPWSERQLAVYHRYTFASDQSVWIILQAPDNIKRRLRDLGTAASGTKLCFSDQLNLHVLLFTSLVHSWRGYINFLESQLVELDDKALYSRVGSSRKFDFLVTFRDVQNLEIVRRKFLKALLVLNSNGDVGKCWMDRFTKFGRSVDEFDLGETLEIMQGYVLDLERHARVVESLLTRLDGTRKLLFQILEYRNDELQIQTTRAIQYNGDQLKALTQAASADNRVMTTLTCEIQNDSKFIKILTTIAMFYTPASLMAAIFSSNLVQTVGHPDAGGPIGFALTKGFYLFPTLTTALIAITLLPALLWQKYRSVHRNRARSG